VRAACDGRGYCSFPAFLYEPLPVSDDDDDPRQQQRVWLSRVEYQRNTDTWHKRKEVRTGWQPVPTGLGPAESESDPGPDSVPDSDTDLEIERRS